MQCIKCHQPGNQQCRHTYCKKCCNTATEEAIATGSPVGRCNPHANRRKDNTSAPSQPPSSAPLPSQSVHPPASSSSSSQSSTPSTFAASSSSSSPHPPPPGPDPSPHVRSSQYAQPLRSFHEMPQSWKLARQSAVGPMDPVQRKRSIQEAQQQQQRSVSLQIWREVSTIS